mgnify:CR=1 FL=1
MEGHKLRYYSLGSHGFEDFFLPTPRIFLFGFNRLVCLKLLKSLLGFSFLFFSLTCDTGQGFLLSRSLSCFSVWCGNGLLCCINHILLFHILDDLSPLQRMLSFFLPTSQKSFKHLFPEIIFLHQRMPVTIHLCVTMYKVNFD